jgi:uncharacterized protein
METVFPLGWQHYLAGGVLIGAGVSLLFVATGLIGGMSTFYTSTLSFISRAAHFRQPKLLESRNWRLLYALGLILGAAAWLLLSAKGAGVTAIPIWQLALGGFIAGFGARLSGGCTSGHGICGMASLQLPSVLAVVIFLAAAMLAARLVRMIGGL